MKKVQLRQKPKPKAAKRYHLNINYWAKKQAASIRKDVDNNSQRDRVRIASFAKYSNIQHRGKSQVSQYYKIQGQS